MTPQMEAAFAGRRVLLAGLLRIVLPDHTIRLCDGSGVVTWGEEVFTGRDPRFGTIGDVEELVEAVGDSIPGLELSLLPPTTSAAVTLSSAAMQGAPVRVWLAVVDETTGAVLPDPELLFAGELDVPFLEVDKGTRKLNLSIASAWERLFEPNEGATLSDSFHRSIFPAERGLKHTAGTQIEKLWGPGEKPPALTSVPDFPRGGVQAYF